MDCKKDGPDFLIPTNRVRDTLEQIDVSKLLIEKYGDTFEYVETAQEARDAVYGGKVASFLGVEGYVNRFNYRRLWWNIKLWMFGWRCGSGHQLGNSLAGKPPRYESSAPVCLRMCYSPEAILLPRSQIHDPHSRLQQRLCRFVSLNTHPHVMWETR